MENLEHGVAHLFERFTETPLDKHRGQCSICQKAASLREACPEAQALHEKEVRQAHTEWYRKEGLTLPDELHGHGE